MNVVYGHMRMFYPNFTLRGTPREGTPYHPKVTLLDKGGTILHYRFSASCSTQHRWERLGEASIKLSYIRSGAQRLSRICKTHHNRPMLVPTWFSLVVLSAAGHARTRGKFIIINNYFNSRPHIVMRFE